MAGTLPPILVELKANAGEFMTKMGEARHEVSKLGTESAGHFSKLQAVGKAAFLGVGAAAVGIGVISVKAALDGEAAHAKLAQAVKNAGGSMAAIQPQVDGMRDHFAKLGFANRELEDGLATMTTSLHDPSKAMGAMGIAADLARVKGVDLSTASIAVAKAMEGQLRPLKQLGIDLPINAKNAEGLKVAQHNLRFATETYHAELIRLHEKHTITAADEATLKVSKDRLTFAQQQVNEASHTGTLVMDALNQRIGGQATAVSETYAGKLAAVKAQAENLAERLGNALLPVIAEVIDKTTSIVGWLEKHSAVAKVLAVAVGTVLVVAIGAYVVAMAAAAVATIAATWPILAIIAAVAAVGVGIYELATHWHAVWGAIASFTSSVGHEILHVLETWGPLALAVLVPFLGIPLLIATHWRQIVNFVEKVWQDALGAIKTVASDIVTFVKGIPGMILGALGDLDHLLIDAGKRVIGGFVHGIEGAAGDVKGALGHLTSKLTSWKGPPEKDAVILFGAGAAVMQGFIDGIESQRGNVEAHLQKFTAKVQAVAAKTKAAVDAARSQLAGDQQSQTSQTSSIATSLAGPEGISSAFDSSGNLGSISNALGGNLATLQRLNGDVVALKAQGLNAESLAQVTSQNAGQGVQLAEQLLSGQDGSIASINDLQHQIDASTQATASAVGNATWGVSIAADTKNLKTLVDKQDEQIAATRDLANQLAQALAHALSSKAGGTAIKKTLQELRRSTGQTLGFT